MLYKKNSERGQALVLIVFAIIGLIGLTAVAVDGGNAYSDRRHAQNAADTAVLAGARAIIRAEDWKAAALSLAVQNGYEDTDNGVGQSLSHANVEIYRCDEVGIDCGEFTDADHIIVKITSIIDTYFARVVGISQMTNRVHAIAEVVPGYYDHAFDGNSVVGTAPTECKAVKYQGTANTSIVGGGIYVNSNCNNAAFFNHSGAATLTAPSLCAVGDIDITGSLGIPAAERKEDCKPLGFPPANMTMPNPACNQYSSISGATMEPGIWPPEGYTGNTDFPPAGVTTLHPGIYCITQGDFVLNAGSTLWGSSILLRIDNGDIHLNGGAQINLSGINYPDSKLHNLLIYMPYPADPVAACSNHEVIINGSSTSTLTGTILAPCAAVSFNGGGDVPTIHGQVIGYTVDLSGSATVNITYNDSENWKTLIPPSMNLSK